MAGRQGALVVLDVASGHLLAHSDLKRAATRRARPGSSLKPFALLALLEAGLIGPRTKLTCRRTLQLAGRHLDCTHPHTGAPLTAARALAYSCNSFFAQAALRLDSAGFAGVLERCGLAQKTGLADPEVAGIVRIARDPEERQLQVLGEAAVEVPPLGMAAAYRHLALLAGSGRGELQPLFEGLRGVTEYGTGQAARVEGLRVAGKTGTPMSRNRAWSHAWFAGFAPAEAPEIALAVFLENGRGGPDAAPIAGSVFGAFAKLREA